MLAIIALIAAGAFAFNYLTQLSVSADRIEFVVLGVGVPKITGGKVLIPVTFQATNQGDGTISVTSIQGLLKANGINVGEVASIEGSTFDIPGRSTRNNTISLGIPLLQAAGAALNLLISQSGLKTVEFAGFYKSNGFDSPLQFTWKKSATGVGGIDISGTGRRLASSDSTDLPGLYRYIRLAYTASVPQIKELARSMRTGDIVQDGERIYGFILSQIRYTHDPDGLELVRTAAATWREKRGDCEDFTILASALGTAMGYKPVAEVVGFGGGGLSHIFATLTDRSGRTVIIDPCPYSDGQPVPYNTRARGITSTHKLPMEAIVMDGVQSAPNTYIYGIGGIGSVSAATAKLQARQSELLQQPVSADVARELRKLRVGIMYNGLPEQAAYLQAFPAIFDIANNGSIIWKEGTPASTVDAIINETTRFAENGYQDYSVDGIGKIKLPGKGSVKAALTKAGASVKSAVKTVAAKVAPIVKAVNKINPTTVAIREAMKAAIKKDYKGFGTKLKYGSLSPNEAQARGLDVAEHAKLITFFEKTQKEFELLGGSKANFMEAVAATKLSGLGVIDDVIALVLPLLKKLFAHIKDVNYKKLTANAKLSKDAQQALAADGIEDVPEPKGGKAVLQKSAVAQGFASEAEKSAYQAAQAAEPAPDGDPLQPTAPTTAARPATDASPTATSALPTWAIPAAAVVAIAAVIGLSGGKKSKK